MKNNRWIICYDFETDGVNPNECNPVELAAVPIHPHTLEIKYDHTFNVVIQPPDINKKEYFTDSINKTIQWHASNASCTVEDIIKKWKAGLSQQIAWKNFCGYCSTYEIDKSPGQWYTEPIAAGYNIIGYDNIILNRLAKKYKTKTPLSGVNKLDLYDIVFIWMENLTEPANFKMDTLRKFFNIKSEGQAHSALDDTIVTAEILVKFIKFHRKQARISKFKNAFIQSGV